MSYATIARAMSEEDLDRVIQLLREGQVNVNATYNEEDGYNLFHHACYVGYLPVVQYLVEAADADITATTRDDYGHTVLHLAAGGGHADVLQYLIEQRNADYKAVNKNGETPLQYTMNEAAHAYLRTLQY
eukprot:TRINITY_DN2427_c0_g2_i1.p1 TRINITY_DN2427_c0_g2~~TRINITY_DN2427_c0_g2_i1.p1  ORF type:complete len:130 (+),score=34.00 TRINITY_DN2427_c0_g2_i1:77-466(+)